MQLLVESVASECGNVKYRDMLRAFKDADTGVRVTNQSRLRQGAISAQHDMGTYEAPALLNKMRHLNQGQARPYSAPVVAKVQTTANKNENRNKICSKSTLKPIKDQQDTFMTSRRETFQLKARKPQHHRQHYERTKSIAQLTSATNTENALADGRGVTGAEHRSVIMLLGAAGLTDLLLP